MKEPNRQRKTEIKAISAVQLNEEQKEAKRLIVENQIVVITGRAGSGKSLVCAQAALDFLKKKQINCIYNTRAAVEVGKSLGYLPGALNDKFDPYMEALVENLNKCCTDKEEVPKLIEQGKVKALPVQFIRGKTVDDIHYAYYATIPPLSQIFPHVDVAPYYQKVNRYQIFFNLTSDQEVIQHGSHTESNSIVWFDPSVTHAFINKSSTDPWRFVVFDIYK
jgi:hypothetical protein